MAIRFDGYLLDTRTAVLYSTKRTYGSTAVYHVRSA
jgi:hypothetical protein